MQVEISNKFSKEEKRFLGSVEIDYVPLIEMVNIVMGTNKYHPTEKDYLQALEFIKWLISKYGEGIKYYTGPGVKILQKEPEELIVWLKEIWYEGKYEDENMNYGVWFDLDLEEENVQELTV